MGLVTKQGCVPQFWIMNGETHPLAPTLACLMAALGPVSWQERAIGGLPPTWDKGAGQKAGRRQ